MRCIGGAAGALLVWACWGVAPAAAQDVAPMPAAGALRLGTGLEYRHHDRVFGETGTEALGGALGGSLDADRVGPLGRLRTDLNALLEAAGSEVRAEAGDLTLGEANAEATADLRSVPMALELGLTGRLAVGVSMTLHRTETRLTRLDAVGGTLGLNPNPTANQEAFGSLGEEFRSLGAATLLPVSGSALGDELVQRVAAAGGVLELPEAPGDSAAFGLLEQLLDREVGVALDPGLSQWRAGDAEIGARLLLLGPADARYPDASRGGIGVRVIASAAVRVPTGAEQPDSFRLLTDEPAFGASGWRAGVVSELFLGRLVWLTLSGSYASTGETTVSRLIAPRESPLAAEAVRSVRWDPGDEVRFGFSPRIRLTPAISLGGELGMVRRSASSFELAEPGDEDASVLDLPAGTESVLGAALRYTTFPAREAGGRVLPLELALGWERAVSGPAGAPRASSIRVQANAYPSLWGRR